MGVYFFWASVHVDTSHPVRVNTHQAVFCRAPERPQARETMARLSFIVAAAAAGVCSAFTAPARTPLALSTPVHVSSRCARARLNPAPHAIDAMLAWLCGLSLQFTELVDVRTGPRSDGRRSRPAPSTTRMLSWRRARRPRAASARASTRTARATSGQVPVSRYLGTAAMFSAQTRTRRPSDTIDRVERAAPHAHPERPQIEGRLNFDFHTVENR